ncbi:MAG TPA: hypothetical protein ENN07_01450 [candidate division Zixibacteria bacterium]|nr:hypothetical protein [candidate division Zixibacteria bacterium]
MKKLLPVLLISFAALSQGLPVYTTLRPDPSFGPVSWFGWSLATGDFNGDGVPDIAVGSPRSDFVFGGDSLAAAGRVDIFFGPIPAGVAYPDMVIGGLSEDDQFGISLSTAGDFNGDGYEDLLVGANVVERKGGAYIFFGGPSFGGAPDVFFLGEEIVDNFGYSSTNIGDQNGDGYDDVLVAALYNDAIGPRTGRCYIYYGAPSHDGTPDFIITGLDSLDDFGTVVSGPLDFNGDGWPDFLVGAVQAGGYWFKPGAGYLFHGGPLLDGVPNLTLTGAHPMEFFGNSVAALEDFTGNGYGDAAFAGYNHHALPDSSVGRVIIAYGGGGADTLIGNRARQSFGSEIVSAGDIDFDGMTELAVSMRFDPTGDSAGFVMIFGHCRYGDTVRVDTTCWNPAPSTRSWFGYRMLGSDDVTGDGMRNFAVADPMFDGGEGLQGAVYVYTGWRDYWPIEAEFISPEDGIVSACPRLPIKWRMRHPSGLEDMKAFVTVLNTHDEHHYTLDSAQLSLIDDSTMIFTPSEDWGESGWVVVRLDSAYLHSTEESIDSAIAVEWFSDLNPPRVRFMGDSISVTDRYPTFVWKIEEEHLNRTDTTVLTATFHGESLRPTVFPAYWAENYIQVAVTLSDFGIVPAHGETITVCLENVMDMPDTCGPNIAEPSCISRIFYRAWNADFTFTSPGLSHTILTFGATPSATDGYDPGLDIFMPPIPDSRVKASFALDDPAYPHINRLLRDLRASEDDTLEWRIITQGEGEASVEWTPERLPVGVWLLNGKLDMRAYPEWHFALGETLSIRFYTGPKSLVAWDLLSRAWELFSLPLYPEIYDPDVVLGEPSAIIFRYAYDPETRAYYEPSRWPTGRGLWLLDADGYRAPRIVGGWPIDTMWAPLSPGWNMISAPFDTTPAGAMTTDPPGAILHGTLYGWDVASYDYFAPAELAPLSGYWVAVSREAELFAPGEGTFLSKSSFAHGFGFPPPPPHLTGLNETKPVLPKEFAISAHPNPFNSAVKITIDGVGAHDRLPLRVEIYDLAGRRVASLIPPGPPLTRGEEETNLTPLSKGGARSAEGVIWRPDASLPSGVYLVRASVESRSLSGAEATIVKRVVYLK